jgi:UDP-galactopyranose mutase
MSLQVDFLIVGSGLTGATIARTLADAGCEVLVLERRNHVGGNVHDHLHSSGVRIHTYGPHYFRTNSKEIWRYVHRFADFFRYEAIVKTLIGRTLEQWPITAQYIEREIGEWKLSQQGTPANFEEACLALMPRLIYEKFVKGYTEKQWGRAATSLSAKLASRFSVQRDDDPRFSRHKHQGIPRGGYTEFMRQMLQGIPVVLNCDYLSMRETFRARQMLVFTGAIDEFFSYDMGKLDYRAQSRQHVFVEGVPYVQSCGQVNNPSPAHGAYIRTLEWKHMMPPEEAAGVRGTVITRESPYSPQNSDHYEYPFPDERNQVLYEAYRSRIAGDHRLMICGRLGEYRYFDMDQAIGRALRLSRRILRFMPLRVRSYQRPSRTHAELLNAAGMLLSSKGRPEGAVG